MDSGSVSIDLPAAHVPVNDAPQPLFCIVDPSLRNFVGHHYAYDAAVAQAATAAGFRTVTLAHHDVLPEIAGSLAVIPCFRRDMWTGSRLARYLPRPLRTAGEVLHANLDFARDLETGLRDLPLLPGSILFAHMVFRNQLSALARFVAAQPPAGPLSVILLLRYQADFYADPISTRAFRTLERAAASGRRVRLASDSARLSAEIGRLTSLPIEVMPIPHTLPAPAPAKARRPHRLRFVSLGNARDEKGYLEILEAIRLLEAGSELDGIEFVLQSNDAEPAVQTAITQFSQRCPPNVTLLRQALSPDEYETQLLAADVVLAPYWRSIYHARTSGVLLEGLAAGKVVITTRDTWMSDELSLCGGGVLVEDRNPASIADAIRIVVRDFRRLSAEAKTAGAACRARHNPAALIQQAAATPPPARGRRIAILYPWEDILDGRSGAALRCGLLIDKLAPLAGEIRVLQDGPEPPLPRRLVALAMLALLPVFLLVDALRPQSSPGPAQTIVHPRHRNVIVESAPIRIRQRLLRILYRAVFGRLLGSRAAGQEMPLWYHLQRRLDPQFAARIRTLVNWADVVLLEYPFWASIVAPACRASGRKLIVSGHDVLHQQVTGSRWLRRLTARAELGGLAAADFAVCVSPADQQQFAAAGVRAAVIPNPIDMDRLRVRLPGNMRLLLRALYDIDLPPGPVCLFVGSRHPPNVKAARNVRDLAARMAASEPAVAFVVAGNCTDPEVHGNYTALGRVENTVFALLYQVASLVLIPLEDGTGSSLKTIEAMGHGLPVLGTATAFRGLDVATGRNCIVENDLAQWPALIHTLLANSANRAAIGANAVTVAEASDYRHLFDAYLPLLGLPPRLPPDEPASGGAYQDALLRDLVARCIARKQLTLAVTLLRGAEPYVELLHQLFCRALDHDDMDAAAMAAGELLRMEHPLVPDEALPSHAAALRALVHHASESGRIGLAHQLLDHLAPVLATSRARRELDLALDAGDIKAAHQALHAMEKRIPL